MNQYILILGVTEHMINLLQEVTDPEQLDKLKSLSPVASASSFDSVFHRHLASLQQMSSKFSGTFGASDRNQPENDREKR